MAGREQGDVRGEERSGYWSRTTTPAASAIRSGALAGSSHTGVPPSGTWTWLSEKGRNVTSQSAPSARAATRCSWALRAKGQR